MKLTGAKCQCPSCNENFVSVRAFDRHRVGEYGKDRRCMTGPEMDEAGFERNARRFRGEPKARPVATYSTIPGPRRHGAIQPQRPTSTAAEKTVCGGAP